MKINNTKMLSLMKTQNQKLSRIEIILVQINEKLGTIADCSPTVKARNSATARQRQRIAMLTNALFLLDNKTEPDVRIPPSLTHKQGGRWIRRLKSEIRQAQADNKYKEEEE